MNYFYQKLTNVSSESANLKDLKNLIRNNELDIEIGETFPLESYGSLTDEIKVKGSKELLEIFTEVDNEKMDLVESLKDMTFNGFIEPNYNISLKFHTIDNLEARGVYKFTTDFLNDVFSLEGFYGFSTKKQTIDILSTALETLFERFPDLKRQYRFLRYNDEWVLRGVTSLSYKNYDNHLVLYLSLLALHNYSENTGNIFTVATDGSLSDSDISIFFEEETPFHIEGVGDVYFRVFVSNGEIRQKRFTFEVSYRIDDGTSSLAAMPELEDPLIKVTHSLKVDSVKNKLDNIFDLDQHKQNMLKYITELKNIKKLSPDAIHYLFNKISRSQLKFTEDTKRKAKMLRENDSIVNNTLTLIEFLNRVNEITTDINEKVHLQRIYDDVIRKITKV
ncbi:hypothetical protein [Peribacillus sp. TH24]|uniref:hypothetical protein n=1 Tax=Peribacillus sp. TH24 TaxID=2798483 RepID=UPI0019137906|nr:hypothetical protein [Peribacillus sp. TH24]MBK5447094.1 hypothetical protein [Peribacillus sp. TH24]MBK5447107.1 hypothetical protein [Peribacillus sp. TH24]